MEKSAFNVKTCSSMMNVSVKKFVFIVQVCRWKRVFTENIHASVGNFDNENMLSSGKCIEQ